MTKYGYDKEGNYHAYDCDIFQTSRMCDGLAGLIFDTAINTVAFGLVGALMGGLAYAAREKLLLPDEISSYALAAPPTIGAGIGFLGTQARFLTEKLSELYEKHSGKTQNGKPST